MASWWRTCSAWGALAMLGACQATPNSADPADAGFGDADAEAFPDAGALPDAALASDSGRTETDAALEEDGGTTWEDASVAPPFADYALLSLNLHCLKTEGTPYASNGARFEAVAALVARERVAVILAQEVCERPGESAREGLLSALEAATSTAWSSEWAYAHEAWTGTPDQAQEGVGIWVRGELADPRSAGYRHQGSLQRVLLAGTLPAALGGFRVHTIHLDHAAPAVRAAQAGETASYALSKSDPSLDLVVAGDFNDVPSSETLLAMERAGFVDLAAGLDSGGIDHVFVHRGAGLRSLRARLVFRGSEPPVSDHPGVLVELGPGPRPLVPRTRFYASSSAAGYLSVRGSLAPLRWEQGLVAWPEGPGQWKLVVTELGSVPFEYKWLQNDLVWQLDPNLQGQGGQDLRQQPLFP